MSDDSDRRSPSDTVLRDVRQERGRQEALRARGKFTHTCATPGISDNASLRVLAEEVDEVLDEADLLRRALGAMTRTMNDDLGNGQNAETREIKERLYRECVQVAAVAVAWCERLRAESRALDTAEKARVE